jgi:hypothetical protein
LFSRLYFIALKDLFEFSGKKNKSKVQKSKTTQSSKQKSGRCHYLSKTTLVKKQKCLYAKVS